MPTRNPHTVRVAAFAIVAVFVLLAWAPRAGAFVYWSNDTSNAGTTIGRANLDGTAATQNFITGASGPHDLAVDGAHIYWANQVSGTIGRANLDGTAVNESFITGASTPVGLAVDGAHLYWTNFNNGNGTTIGRANVDGTGVDQSFITGASGPHSVAVDGAHVYWSNFGVGNGTTIGRANLDGTGVDQSFITGASVPTGVAVDGAHIYWSNWADGAGTTIGRANLDGTGVDQSFITGASAPVGLAVDSADLYWGNCADASCSGTTIGRANLDGSGVNESFISGVGGPAGIAVDGLSPPPPVPVNTGPPTISGTALPEDNVTCSNGSWTNNPTTFTHTWNRSGAPIAGATSMSYTVRFADEGQTLSCTVVASNASGANAATSPAVLVALPGTQHCPRPSGRLRGVSLGPLTLGESRARARQALPRFGVTYNNMDDFCLLAGWGIRVGYPSGKLLGALSPAQRPGLNGRIVLALTANPFYALDGVRPGMRVAKVARRLHLGRAVHIGLNFWYIAPGRAANGVVKVRHGIVEEVGIANARLTRGRAAQQRFLNSFPRVRSENIP
jgi:hypothetical protein